MHHISIEGMDGVGKTTTCQLLAKKLGYKFIEKPLHYLFDKDASSFEEYLRIRNMVNASEDRNFTSLFYGLGNVYIFDRFKDVNIVTDRHLASNYAWSGTKDNEDIYALLVKKTPKPDLTVILYAKESVIVRRIRNRDKIGDDINKVHKSEEIYRKMLYFCKKYRLPYILIDSTDLSVEEVVDIIIEEYKRGVR